MATNTTNYSFKKPDESDFYDVQDQNGNWDMADEALKSLDTPTFEDYTGSTPVPAANTAIDGIKSKTKLSALMSNIKAAFKGACLIGHIVNNCVTNNPNLPLSAAQGKVLMDLYTRLNGELGTRKATGVIKDDTRRGLYCGMDFSDAPADGWLVLIYCFIESNSTGFCIAFGINGKSEGHIYGFIYSGGWTDYVINFC